MVRDTHSEWLRRVSTASSLQHIHPVEGIVTVLGHRDIDIEFAVDVMKFWRPRISER